MRSAQWRRLIHQAIGELSPAYGAVIQTWLSSRAGFKPGLATVHRHLQWLEKNGFIISKLGDPRTIIGGRRRREYRHTGKALPEQVKA
jgi:hypothetical protein